MSPLPLLLLCLMLLILLMARESDGGTSIAPCKQSGGFCSDKSLCTSDRVIQIKKKSLRQECGEHDVVCCQIEGNIYLILYGTTKSIQIKKSLSRECGKLDAVCYQRQGNFYFEI
ncbi:unnamed protein product [Meganyctiphanes norvegica]|uniref:Uncharacterized protein n=1 Tax=Meganyctiphanes norvegica TaxID=48144 RepID=A0AAV2QU93_MEGNR